MHNTEKDKKEDYQSLKRNRIDLSRLGLLKDKIPPNHPLFDLEIFRTRHYDRSLRD